MKEYYKAYDKRYKQVHNKNLSWSSNNNSIIVESIINKYNITKEYKILEIGCGEGRDARYLLNKNYNLLALDVSKEAINYCKKKDIYHKDNYQVLDILNYNNFNNKYDYIYSVSCLHMLVTDNDRNKYYKFIYNHLNNNGISLILSLGDGLKESSTDITKSWQNTTRIHEETKKKMEVATTSCRIVNFKTLEKEITNNNLKLIESGITQIIPDFPEIMYVVVKRM